SERLTGVHAAIAVRTLHLRDQMIGRLPFWLGPDRMVDPEKLFPVAFPCRPVADALEIGGPGAKLIPPPRHQEHVFGRAKLQERRIDLRRAKDDQSRRGAFDFPTQLGANLAGSDLFQPRLDHRIAGGQIAGVTMTGHQNSSWLKPMAALTFRLSHG